MRRSMTLLAGAAMATALLASGCSAGQIAETAVKVPSVGGTSGDVTVDGGSLSVRNAMVAYDAEGYEAGADAPLELAIFNDTSKAVTVTVTSPDAKSVTLSAGAKGTPSPSASASPSPSVEPSATTTPSGTPTATPSGTPTATPSGTPTATAEPAAPPPARQATVEIVAGSFAVLSQAGSQFAELLGLNEELKPGGAVQLVFDFGGGTKLTLDVPMAVPLTAGPRASAEVREEEH